MRVFLLMFAVLFIVCLNSFANEASTVYLQYQNQQEFDDPFLRIYLNNKIGKEHISSKDLFIQENINPLIVSAPVKRQLYPERNKPEYLAFYLQTGLGYFQKMAELSYELNANGNLKIKVLRNFGGYLEFKIKDYNNSPDIYIIYTGVVKPVPLWFCSFKHDQIFYLIDSGPNQIEISRTGQITPSPYWDNPVKIYQFAVKAGYVLKTEVKLINKDVMTMGWFYIIARKASGILKNRELADLSYGDLEYQLQGADNVSSSRFNYTSNTVETYNERAIAEDQAKEGPVYIDYYNDTKLDRQVFIFSTEPVYNTPGDKD